MRARRTLLLLVAALGALASGRPAHAAGPVQAVAERQDVGHTSAADDADVRPPFARAWTHVFEGDVGYPLIAGGRVFTVYSYNEGLGSRVAALDAQTGRLLWEHAINAFAVAYDGGRLFSVTVTGSVTAFDAGSGAVIWSRQLPGDW